MVWKVTQLSGNDATNTNGKEEETTLNTRDENPDNLFEIIPKLLIDRSAGLNENGFQNNESFQSKIFLVTTTAGGSTGLLGSNELIGLGFDKTFMILTKELDGVEKSVDFDSSIDFVLWQRSILLIGLSSSEIVLLHPTTLEKTASKQVCATIASDGSKKYDRPPFFVNAFIHSTSSASRIDLLAVGVKGDIYSFPNISLAEDCLEFTQDESMSMISINIDMGTIKGSLLRSYLKEDAKVITAASPWNDLMITGETSGTISMFDIGESVNISEESCGNFFGKPLFRSANLLQDLGLQKTDIVIAKLIHCEGVVFALLTNGQLHLLLDEVLLPVRGLKLPSSDCFIHDFDLVVCNSGAIKLWLIYTDKNDHYIAIYPSPGFKQPEFKVKIPSSTNSESETSSFKFPTQSSLLDEPTSFIQISNQNGSTTIYQMSEFSTDISLQNLLAKGRFEKAELLATKYEKDLDIVWKAKVRGNADELTIYYQQNDKNCQKKFNEILKTLELIKDVDWVCGFVVNERRVPKLEWIKDLLSLGLKCVSGCSSSVNGQKLLLTRKKLYTFEQVLPTAQIKQWNEFNDEKNSMFAQCLWFLDNGEFQKCQIVWLRHSDEFIPTTTVQDLARFFKILFDSQLKSEAAISLFKTILPHAIEKCAESEAEAAVVVNSDGRNFASSSKINALLLLIRSQLRSLEREKQWPVEALAFTRILISVVLEEISSLESEKDMGCSEEAQLIRKINICNEVLKKLQNLLQALTELSLLKTNHSIRIPFEKYTTESVIEVVNSMLRVLLAREEVELFIKNFLRPFANRNKLDMDNLFQEHIKCVAEEVPYFVHASGIPFEERVVTLVTHVGSIKCKLDCVLIMAENWPVPWFPLMDDLVKRSIDMNLSSGDNNCIEIQNHIKWLRLQVPYRCLQTKYRLIPHKLNTGFGVQMALLRILKWKKPNYFEDCLELIKHTGKYDEDGVRTFKFWIELSDSDLPIQEIITDDLTNKELLTKMLERVLLEFRTGYDSCYSEAMWERFTECTHLIANRVDDKQTLEFLKLRKIIPNLWNDDIITSVSYPFSALELLLQTAHIKTSAEVINDCNKLSIISFTNYKNLLVIAAAFFVLPGPGSALQKIWDIIGYILQTEELLQDVDNDIVAKAGLTVVHELANHIPTLTTQQLETLHEFCRLLANSFEDITTEPISKLFGILRIFETLREQEIPLEKEFMSIYKEVWREGIQNVTSLLNSMKNLGESLLRFGNKELHSQVFNAVQLELGSQVRNTYGKSKEGLIETAENVGSLKKSLLKNASNFEEVETNQRVISLVKSLDEAGLTMNSYALRKRDKGKLISKLLEMNLFQLAAQTALVFEYKDSNSWSNILQQYMWKGSINDLKTILESLKKIADLWVLKEFAASWLKVSEVYPMFRHMCPIPLD